ncbi:hypothetical protein A2870_04820 [Candidatus Curtissbacteria bacterium RIFCSPHIGHO2_01_FULL_41_11]|uniref:Uncharacterized protein n=1 Tax=Candidatus Curtissbacteria bacterium RIFCSPHIGHO2_01_FULL_41_11 TaxID=1797711 RepID=A0A1F5G307_9BACT|nr:MAG: hypothetical protein A2870_04820 [Candidatus Curtissbacteria bacterium RIFCSPHIGHO2_01_FULL_41_11]
MKLVQIISIVSYFAITSIFAAIIWLYIDALSLRFEVKSFLKFLAFSLLTLAFFFRLTQGIFNANFSNLEFWLQSSALWLILASYLLDYHSKLQLLTIIGIISIFFLKNYALLAVQSFLISVVILQISYSTKHKDLIPLISGFGLLSISEFFNHLEKVRGIQNFSLAANFVLLFASLTFFYWLWSYLAIRFSLGKT